VKPIFLIGCYGCTFHRTGNSTQLCQNLGISGAPLNNVATDNRNATQHYKGVPQFEMQVTDVITREENKTKTKGS
jgi:hypothetical protein